MTEEGKKRIATFRFGVIAELVNSQRLAPGEQSRLIEAKCKGKWQIPFSTRTRLSRATILRWVRLYRESKGKLESLYPRDRADQGRSRALDEETSLALIRLREELPRARVADLIAEMHARKLIGPDTHLAPSTVYRFLHCQGLMPKALSRPEDRRKFEAELPNDLWQSDVMHGPRVRVGEKQAKTYLIAIEDDQSRLICHGQFYLSERLSCYLEALEQALLKRGLPRKLYVDNGPAFRSHHLQHICASLGIALIHSSPYKPQGRGKIERFYRTVRSDFLAGFKGNSLGEINEAFDLWLNDIYHQRKHGGTGRSPFERFSENMHCIRTAPANLRDYFRETARRRVAKDRTVTLNGRLYEAPVALIGQQVELLYHAQYPERVEVRYKQKSYGMLRPVDLHVNCRVKRDRNRQAEILPSADRSCYRGGKLL